MTDDGPPNGTDRRANMAMQTGVWLFSATLWWGYALYARPTQGWTAFLPAASHTAAVLFGAAWFYWHRRGKDILPPDTPRTRIVLHVVFALFYTAVFLLMGWSANSVLALPGCRGWVRVMMRLLQVGTVFAALWVCGLAAANIRKARQPTE